MQEIIDKLSSHNVHVFLENGKLKTKAEKNAISKDIADLIVSNKVNLVNYLEKLAQLQEVKPASSSLSVRRQSIVDDIPLSYDQQRLWFIDKLQGGSSEYNITVTWIYPHLLDTQDVCKAFTYIIQKHEVLRTIFVEKEGVPYQVVHSKFDFNIEEYDLTQLSQQQKVSSIKEIRDKQGSERFNLDRDMLLKVSNLLVTKGSTSQESCLVLTIHHIITDGWSMSLLRKEFEQVYQCLVKKIEYKAEVLPIQYRDYAIWQRELAGDEFFKTQLAYWQEQLTDAPVLHSLPLDFIRPKKKSLSGASMKYDLEPAFSRRITAYCQKNNLTSFMFAHGLVSFLLSLHSGTDDIVIGTPVAGRTSVEVEKLLGFFVNTLLLRTNTNYKTFGEYFKQVKRINLDAQANQQVPFNMLVELLCNTRNSQHTPLFQIMFSMNTNLKGSIDTSVTKSNKLSYRDNISAKFDMIIDVNIEDNGGWVNWTYDTTLFAKEHVEDLLLQYISLIEQVVVGGVKELNQVNLLLEKDRKKLERIINNTDCEFDQSLSVDELFSNAASSMPDKIAIIKSDVSSLPMYLSFGALNSKVELIANNLLDKGISFGDRVAICLERTFDLIASILAVMKVGATYVPIEAVGPIERIRHYLADSGSILTITKSTLMPTELLASTGNLIDLDDIGWQKSIGNKAVIDQSIYGLKAKQIAYIIYTSGSTGRPKGVMVTHENILAFKKGFENQLEAIGVDEDSSWLWNASFTFDASVKGLVCLANGQSVVLASQAQAQDPALICEIVDKFKIDICNVTPQYGELLLEYLSKPEVNKPSLIISGEKVSAPLQKKLCAYQYHENKLSVNAYGPTETTVNSSYALVNQTQSIGKPIANTKIYLLGQNQNMVPFGAIGEIFISGKGLSVGYLNNPSLTASKFIPNPFSSDGGRLYKTGDLARFHANGELEYIGRLDRQIKVRGYRIELGEIENEISNFKGISACKVILCEESNLIVAYVITGSGLTKDKDEYVREVLLQLRNVLPRYMLPSSIICVDQWPLNSSGKLNIKALPKPTLTDNTREYVPARTKTEMAVLNIWSDLLNLKSKDISVNSDFFVLGGHSLLIVRLVAEIRSAFNKTISVEAAFNNPTIEALATLVDSIEVVSEEKSLDVKPVERNKAYFQLSFAQERIWFLNRLNPSGAEYNIPKILPIHGDFNVDLAESSLLLLIRKHEPLRTIFIEIDGEPQQAILTGYNFKLEQYDLSKVDSFNKEQRLKAIKQEFQARTFDLSSDLMVRAAYVKVHHALKEQVGYLLLSLHHIACDGWSLNRLTNEFLELYHSLESNPNQVITPLKLNYIDYATWQRRCVSEGIFDRQFSYWQKNLADLPVEHCLRLSRERPAVKKYDGGAVRTVLSSNDSRRINEFCRESSLTPFMLAHAALGLTLSLHSNSTDIAIGTVVANRTRQEFNDIVGMFVNTLVLRTNTHFSSLSEYLGHVKKVNINAQENQDVPFEYLVDLLKVPRSLQFTPLFQVMLNMNNNERPLTVARAESHKKVTDGAVAKFDLTINIDFKDSQGYVSWIYDNSIFEHAMVEQLNKHFINTLKAIVANNSNNICDINALTARETKYLVDEVNSNYKRFDDDIRLNELIEKQSHSQPDKVAVTTVTKMGLVQLSYGELNTRANQVARYLIKEYAFKKGTKVGIFFSQGPEFVVAVISILKAGGIFVPIDPKVPAARVNYIVEDANIPIIMSGHAVEISTDSVATKVIRFDDPLFNINLQNFAKENLKYSKKALTSADDAYVIYTSGSTGNPKGVSCTHKSVVNLVDTFEEIAPLDRYVNALFWSSPSFDASIYELFTAVCCGHTLVIPEENTRTNNESLFGFIFDNKVEALYVPPFFVEDFKNWLSSLDKKPLLKRLMVGVEPLKLSTLKEIKKHIPQLSIINAYGPTEATVISSVYRVDLKDNENTIHAPIGRGINNCSLYVLDESRRLVPVGVPGELFIGGVNLSSGYLNNKALTERSFVKNPFYSGRKPYESKKLYKTGDVVKWLEDGNLMFVGRNDKQVKIRGYRIELGEIESTLSNLAQVKQALVIVKDIPGIGKSLVAYLVPAENIFTMAEVDPKLEEIKALVKCHLDETLPQYMHPNSLVILKEWPLTHSGKIDRNALPEPMSNNTHADDERALSMTESKLVKIWGKLFSHGTNAISRHSEFFAVGGHSLLAVRLVSEIKAEFQVDIEVSVVFENTTIAKLAKYLEECENNLQLEAIEKVDPGKDCFPLSFAQERLWFIDKLGDGSPEYNISLKFPVSEDFDLNIADLALNKLIDRHTILKTKYGEKDGIPIQNIINKIQYKIEVVDVKGKDQQSKVSNLKALIHKEQVKPFDLAHDLMIRTKYYRVASGEDSQDGLLLVVIHHIASDGWSVNLFKKEFSELYQQIAAGNSIESNGDRLQYVDFASWQRKWLKSESVKPQLDYWKVQLKDVPMLHSLPLDFRRPEVRKNIGAGIAQSLLRDDCKKIQAYCSKYKLTPFMFFHGVFSIVLAKHGGNPDIVIGTPVANRTRAELESLMGFFVNTVILRVSTEVDNLKDYWESVKSVNISAQENQDVPFEFLVDMCQVHRTVQYTPLFQIMFSMNTNEQAIDELSMRDNYALRHIDGVTTKFDLSLDADITSNEGSLYWSYDTSIFSKSHIEALHQDLIGILSKVINNQATTISELTAISADQYLNCYDDSTSSLSKEAKDTYVDSLIKKCAQVEPEKVAVVFGAEQLTYGELENQASRFANMLVDTGVSAGSFVGVSIERSIDLIVAINGILKTGAAYLPLDPNYPENRLNYMVQDSGVKHLVVNDCLSEEKFNTSEICVINIADFKTDKYLGRDDNKVTEFRKRRTPEKHPCYVIYTSGTTGQPKGVVVSHQNVIAYLGSSSYPYAVNNEDRILQFSSPSFDIFVEETFVSLTHGATLVLRDDDIIQGNERFWAFVGAFAITFMSLPTAYWHQLTSELTAKTKIPALLRMVVVGGEVMQTKMVEKWQQYVAPTISLLNTYGPTETTVIATSHHVSSNDLSRSTIPIGKMLPGVQCYIVDQNDNLCPPGVFGELLIGGNCVALGYLNQSELTKEKFIDNPFSEKIGDRLYRTGDIVRMLFDNSIEFSGRKDKQVKIRGYRVDLGEIEYHLNNCSEIESSLVVTEKSDEGVERLISYVKLNPGEEIVDGGASFRKQLGRNLAEFMVPTFYVMIAEWPMTPGGKIDYKKLPSPDLTVNFTEFVLPNSESEKQLVDIWSKILDLPREKISITSNFFTIGGHSLFAVRLLSEIRHQFNKEISLRKLFNNPTIAELAMILDEEAIMMSQEIKPVDREQDGYRLSFAQERMWFLSRMEGESTDYNIPVVVPIAGDFRVEVAELAFIALIKRHEVLRTNYLEQEGVLIQRVNQDFSFSILKHNLADLDEATRIDRVKQLVRKEKKHQFNLEKELMIRAAYISSLDNNGDQDGVLIYNVHHIATDGWSMDIIAKELAEFYQSILENRQANLDKLTIQYIDYAHWQRSKLESGLVEKQMLYWESQLKGAPITHSLPLDFSRPQIKEYRGAGVTQSLSSDACRQIIDVAKSLEVTPFMFILSIIGLVVARHSGSSDLIFGTPVANRVRKEIEPVVGFFVNTIALRLQTNHRQFLDYLQHVKRVNLEAQTNQDIPFEALVERLNTPRTAQHTPIFQIMYGMVQEEWTDTKTEVSNESDVHFVENLQAKFDLSIDAKVNKNGGFIAWVYDSSLFRRGTVEDFNQHFMNLLQQIVEQPEVELSQLQMLSKSDIDILVKGLNHKSKSLSSKLTVDQLFAKRAKNNSDAIAISCHDFKQEPIYLSYGELESRSNKLANYLGNRIDKKDKLIGICINRSIDMIISILGVLKAGAAYVPLDPSYPKMRLEYMIEDSRIDTLLCHSELVSELRVSNDVKLVSLDLNETKKAITNQSDYLSPERNGFERKISDLAYVIYTSGSTGKPKGVLVEHSTLAPHIETIVEYYNFIDNDNVLQFASFSFDTFVEQTFAALISGAHLHIRGDNIWGPQDFFEYTKSNKISVTDLSPNYLSELLQHPDSKAYWRQTTITRLVVGGESLPANTVDRWFALNTNFCELFNAYGPTEATITTTISKVTPESGVAIGYPLANRKLYILDGDQNFVPFGAVGELFIGGFGIARGYFSREALTKNKFVDSPFNSSEVLYRTGDLVRCTVSQGRNNSELEFIGRVDDQIKIRGFRVELSEIEYELASHPSVESCIVILSDENNLQRLVAYVVFTHDKGGEKLAKNYEDELANFMSERLPAYMQPSVYTPIDAIPLMPNGKVDRVNLPSVRSKKRTNKELPQGAIEEWLAAVWEELFNEPEISRNDNFFSLGGHSLLTIQLASRINEKFKVSIPIFEFFQNQVLRNLAGIIEKARTENEYKQLVKLNASLQADSIIMIPGQGGSSHVFFDVVHSLANEYSIYGIDASGLDGIGEVHKSIEDIAEFNMRLLDNSDDISPILIVGHSLGGCVAFEMAKHLEKASDKSVLLVVIDSGPTLDNGNRQTAEKAENEDTGVQEFADIQSRISYSASEGMVENMLILQSSENNQSLKSEWQRFVRNPIEEYEVPGNHFSMLKKPGARVIARIINSELSRIMEA